MTQANLASGDVQAALDAGAALADKKIIEGVPVFVTPPGYHVHQLESLLPAPIRKHTKTSLNDVQSFIAVVNDQKGDATRLYSQVSPPKFTAVFNDTAAGPGWRDHTAVYAAPLSPEWKTWTSLDAKAMSQVDFAVFLETNLLDVVDPAGAVLLEIARTLEAKKKVEFKSSIRLSDGSHQFSYDEDVQGSAQKGTLKVPEQFVIGIPVFENGDPWRIDVRLRYRIADGGKLSLWYELIRPHKVIETAVNDVRARIEAETDLSLLNGAPV